MSQKIALLDWDNTLRPGFTVVEWLDHLHDVDLISGAASAKTRDLVATYQRGSTAYETFASAVVDVYLHATRDIEIARLTDAAETYADASPKEAFSWVQPLVAYLISAEVTPIVLTGAPVEPVMPQARHLGIENVIGLQHAVTAGRCAGFSLMGNTALRSRKAELVRGLADHGRVVFAMGDSPADEPMLRAASLRIRVETSEKDGVSFHFRSRSATRLKRGRRSSVLGILEDFLDA